MARHLGVQLPGCMNPSAGGRWEGRLCRLTQAMQAADRVSFDRELVGPVRAAASHC